MDEGQKKKYGEFFLNRLNMYKNKFCEYEYKMKYFTKIFLSYPFISCNPITNPFVKY